MSDEVVLARRFPEPPRFLAALMDELREAAAATEEAESERRRVAAMPHPWDPASCPANFRGAIYAWLDEVVAWINEQHTWRPDHVVPVCWDLHPHIVHELATIACLRWEAGLSCTPNALELWQRDTLPAFLSRIVDRIGETGCPPGRHQPSPGISRHGFYREGEEPARRLRHRAQDQDTLEIG